MFRESDRREVLRCLVEVVADEQHRRGCIFGLALNSYQLASSQIWQGCTTAEGPSPCRSPSVRSAQDQAGGIVFRSSRTLVAYCGVFVDVHRAADAATREQERGRLLACVAGSMIGMGYGTIADDRAPGWLVQVHCAQLEDALELAWLDDVERRNAAQLCYEAGTLCAVAGACTEPVDILSLFAT